MGLKSVLNEHSVGDLAEKLLLFFGKNDLNLLLDTLRAQGYDGAANMREVYNGLQAKILDKNPNAPYTLHHS